MLQITDRTTPTCIVVRVEGAVSGDEYDDFADAVENALDRQGELNLVAELVGSVKYGDVDAAKEDLEFASHEYRKIRRAAFVGDQKLIRTLMKVFSPFTRTEERFFSAKELDAAIEWASAQD